MKLSKKLGAWLVLGLVAAAAGGGTTWWLLRPQADEAKAVQAGSTPLAAPQPATAGGSLAVDSSASGVQGVALGGQTPSGSASSAGSGSRSSASGSGGSSSEYAPTAKELADYAAFKSGSDVHYFDYQPGNGSEAKAGQQLVVNYRGWLADGRKFDDSYAKGQPFVFTIGQHKVITGFEVGALGMKVGGRRRVVIPPSGGYGAAGKDSVPPDALLVFDIELVAVQEP